MRRLLWLLLPAAALTADLGSKAWILRNLAEGESLPVIKGFFSLTLGFTVYAVGVHLMRVPEAEQIRRFVMGRLGRA